MTAAIQSRPKAKSSSFKGKKSFSEEEIEQSIKSQFRDIKGSIMIRPLWTKDSVHRFRVNWWKNGQLDTSKFVIVAEKNKSLTVKEVK